MQWLIDFVSSIGSMLKSLLDFVVGAFTSLIQIVKQLPNYLTLISAFFGDLPPVFTVTLAVTLTVTIIFLATGRGEGGD